jgi:hypothetical protein
MVNVLKAACFRTNSLRHATVDRRCCLPLSSACVSSVLSRRWLVFRSFHTLHDGFLSREYTMQGDYALGSYQNGVLTAQVYGASCSAEGGNGILAGSCATSTGTSCTFGMMCVDGMCLTNLPAPVEGPQGFPNVDGTWTTSGGTCSSFPGFSSTFNIIQCGYSLLVLPNSQVGRHELV